ELYLRQRLEASKKQLAKAEAASASATEIDRLQSTLRQAQTELETALPKSLNGAFQMARLYENFPDDSYRWLLSKNEHVSPLVDDVRDTLRALRCADALRQRGSMLKTSAGYQIFVDFQTASCVHAFEDFSTGMMFLLETAD